MRSRARPKTSAAPGAAPAEGGPGTERDAVRYRALTSRDRRFDGRFFVAVRTTRIYCRPVCPAPTPKAKNVSFFTCAAAAEAAGYRPCLRCRPESSPGTPAWMGTSATVARALRLIDSGALDDAGVEQLAARLGIGDRHLRRLFLEHAGATPVAVAHTRRVQIAKKLLDETTLPIARVALDAGFSSIRRFNEAMRATYGRAPSTLRRERRAPAAAPGSGPAAPGARQAGDGESALVLRLAYRPPLAWNELLEFLGARAIGNIECAEDGRYHRRVRIGAASGIVTVAHDADACCLRVSVPIGLSRGITSILTDVRRVFDLDADPAAIASVLCKDPRLAARLRACPGLRVPGAWLPFETAVRAVVGQQVTVRGATTLIGRIVERFGEHERDVALSASFPSPETLAGVSLEGIGMPRTRARTVTALARAVADGDVLLDGSRPLDETVAALQRVEGIGPWTSSYIAMRALAEPDALPVGDLGLLRALAGTSGKRPSPSDLDALARQWRPWRAYAALYLWTVADSADRSRARSTKTARTRECSARVSA